jgi:hypothetical protein
MDVARMRVDLCKQLLLVIVASHPLATRNDITALELLHLASSALAPERVLS